MSGTVRAARALCACLLLAAVPAEAPAAEFTRAEAVNKAGRQRMLTQRIVKSYCQIGLGADVAGARAQLADALRLFEVQLAQVKPYAPRAALELERSWPAFRAIASGPVNAAGAALLREKSARLLEAAERLTAELGEPPGDRVARLVNVAGRQRMLSQRIAKAYLLVAWSVGSDAEANEIREASAEFGAGLGELRAADENTAELRTELAAVGLQWEWLGQAVVLKGDTAYPLVVADASEAILQRMERITRLYEALGAR